MGRRSSRSGTSGKNKPIFLSIGYSTCHWCHVLEKESFENEEVAALLNEYFICIKVDREENPDVDQFYMSVVQAMTGSGGWPLTVVMTPQKIPIFGGTYFPRNETHENPGCNPDGMDRATRKNKGSG